VILKPCDNPMHADGHVQRLSQTASGCVKSSSFHGDTRVTRQQLSRLFERVTSKHNGRRTHPAHNRERVKTRCGAHLAHCCSFLSPTTFLVRSQLILDHK
jgi:hypothetical protein